MRLARQPFLPTLSLLITLPMAAVLAGCDGNQHPTARAECTYYGGGPAATFFYPAASVPVAQPYGLRVAAVYPYAQSLISWSGPSVALDADADGRPDVFGARAEMVDGRMLVTITSWNPYVQPPQRDVCRGPLVCVSDPARGAEGRLVVWDASFSYEPAPPESACSATSLFIRSLSSEAMAEFDDRFLRAAREASGGRVLRATNRIERIDFDGNVSAEVGLPPSWNATSGVDWGDGSIVLAVANGYGNNELHYALVDQPRLASRVVAVGRGSATPYGSARGIARVPLTGDGRPWLLRTGAGYAQRCVCDIDSDGAEDLLTVTYSPMNGVSGAGTTDRGCGYVIRLDERGNEVWRTRWTGPYLGNQFALGDVDADGESEIVAVSSGVTSTHHGEIVVLSADGSLASRNASLGGMTGLVLADLTGDGIPEIISGGSGGRVAAFNDDLEIVAEFADTAYAGCAEKLSIPLLANDLDGDGEVELVVLSNGWTLNDWDPRVSRAGYTWSRHEHVTILDRELHEEARVALPNIDEIRPVIRGGGPVPNNIAIDLNADGVNEIVLFTNAGIYVIELAPAAITAKEATGA